MNNKIKHQTLLSGYEDGWIWRIGMGVYDNEVIASRGHFNFIEKRGFQGKYKGKSFLYEKRLPKGKVRHHVYYNDEDPNDGVTFVTPEKHMQIHNKGGRQRWKL